MLTNPGMLMFAGGLVAVLGMSARKSYEELDENLPYIVWPSLLLQCIGFGLVAFALWSNQGYWRWMAMAAAVLLSLAAILDATVANTVAYVNGGITLIAYGLLAAAVGSGDVRLTALAAAAAIALQFTEGTILPFQEHRRVTYGPGMILLPLAWLLLAYVVNRQPSLMAGVSATASLPIVLRAPFAPAQGVAPAQRVAPAQGVAASSQFPQ